MLTIYIYLFNLQDNFNSLNKFYFSISSHIIAFKLWNQILAPFVWLQLLNVVHDAKKYTIVQESIKKKTGSHINYNVEKWNKIMLRIVQAQE